MPKSKKELVESLLNHTKLTKADVNTTPGSAGLYKSGIKKLLDSVKDGVPEKSYKEHIREKYSPGT